MMPTNAYPTTIEIAAMNNQTKPITWAISRSRLLTRAGTAKPRLFIRRTPSRMNFPDVAGSVISTGIPIEHASRTGDSRYNRRMSSVLLPLLQNNITMTIHV